MENIKCKYRGKEFKNFTLKYVDGKLEIVEIHKKGDVFSSQPRQSIFTSIDKVEFIKDNKNK